MGNCVGVGAWRVDGGWMPLPTRPQRYCDPASLVSNNNIAGVLNPIFVQQICGEASTITNATQCVNMLIITRSIL